MVPFLQGSNFPVNLFGTITLRRHPNGLYYQGWAWLLFLGGLFVDLFDNLFTPRHPVITTYYSTKGLWWELIRIWIRFTKVSNSAIRGRVDKGIISKKPAWPMGVIVVCMWKVPIWSNTPRSNIIIFLRYGRLGIILLLKLGAKRGSYPLLWLIILVIKAQLGKRSTSR